MEKTRVLLAEDDFDFGSILKQYLEIHNFEVTWAQDGQEALTTFSEQTNNSNGFQLCVLDVMMPKMDGFTVAEKIISINPEVPFIFLTAKKMKEDKIQGLKLGADDYIVKPFEADLLVLRLQNILKRSQRTIQLHNQDEAVSEEYVFQIGKYEFDWKNHQLKIEDRIQKLTDKETKLIGFFYENKNQLVKRDDLLNNVWGSDDFFSGRSMDVFISRIRKYFKEDPSIAIESSRGVGLTFKVN